MENKTSVGLGISLTSLLLNIFVLPGLGTLIAKPKDRQGILQLVLTIVGIALAFFIVGIPMIIASWIWSLSTSIKLIKKADKQNIGPYWG